MISHWKRLKHQTAKSSAATWLYYSFTEYLTGGRKQPKFLPAFLNLYLCKSFPIETPKLSSKPSHWIQLDNISPLTKFPSALWNSLPSGLLTFHFPVCMIFILILCLQLHFLCHYSTSICHMCVLGFFEIINHAQSNSSQLFSKILVSPSPDSSEGTATIIQRFESFRQKTEKFLE